MPEGTIIRSNNSRLLTGEYGRTRRRVLTRGYILASSFFSSLKKKKKTNSVSSFLGQPTFESKKKAVGRRAVGDLHMNDTLMCM